MGRLAGVAALGAVMFLGLGIMIGDSLSEKHICEPVGPEVQQEWQQVSGDNKTLYLCVEK